MNSLFRIELVDCVLIVQHLGSLVSTRSFRLTFLDVYHVLAISTSWHDHLAHWHIWLSCPLFITAPPLCISIFISASIIFLKFLLIVLKAGKAVANETTEGLHASLALRSTFFLCKFCHADLLGATVDLWHLFLSNVGGGAVVRILGLLVVYFLLSGQLIFYLLPSHFLLKLLALCIKSVDSFKLTSVVISVLNAYGAPIILLLCIIIEFNQFFLDTIEQTYFSSKVLLLVFMIHKLKYIFHFCVKFQFFTIESQIWRHFSKAHWA